MSAASYLQTCPACRHEFRAAAKHLGRQVACPTCRKPITIHDAVPVADKLVGKTIGGVTLQRRLGAGALGVVYEGTRADGARVAVKLLSSQAAQQPDVVARFQREARLAMEIHNPGVVPVYDCGHERGAHYLVMEFVDGPTLAAMVEDNPLPWREAINMVRPIAVALAAIHAQGIIHRDIKPANILVGADGAPKLADLGLAKHLPNDKGDETSGLTMQNVALGSPAYMPPEQIRDARSVGTQADIYALGATLFESLTGNLPFNGRSASEVMNRVLKDPAPDPRSMIPDLPSGVAVLVMATLAKNPDDRPVDAAALVTALDNVLANPEATLTHPKRTASRSSGGLPVSVSASTGGGIPWWLWALIVVVVTAMGVAIKLFLFP